MILAVIPCYNEASTIGEVVSKTMKYATAIVADSNSPDGTAYQAEKYGATVCQNGHKMGAGANTCHGLNKAVTMEGDILVTLDGDGQHNPNEIPQLIKPILDGNADVVIGSRFMEVSKIQRYRRAGIWIITLLYNVFSKQKLTDAQCCFRAFKKEVIEAIDITEAGFAFSTEMIIKIRAKGYRIVEVPVSCIYHPNFEQNSSLNPIIHGFCVALATVKWRIKIELANAIKFKLFGLFKKIIKPFVGTGIGGIKPVGNTYRYIARNLIPEQKRVVDINGYKMAVRIDIGRDIDGISQQLIFDGYYEPVATKLVKKIIEPHMVTVDIGANIGYYSLLLSKLSKQVWAFEPEDRNYKDLLTNIKLNGMTNIYSIKKAVTDRTGTAEFYVSDKESGEHSLVKCRNVNKTVMVETVALSDIFGSVDFMKIDTEGNEMYVLKGFYESLKENNTKLLLEFWIDGIQASGYAPADLWELLEGLGYSHIYMIDEFNKDVRLTDLNDISSYWWKHKFSSNILCLKERL